MPEMTGTARGGARAPSSTSLSWESLQVRRELLHSLEPFDRGGEGSVSKVVGATPALLYKEYHPDVRARLREAPLLRLVEFPRLLADADVEWLYARAAWPTWAVSDGDATCGVVVPQAPPRCMTELRRSSGGWRVVPAKVELLLNGDEFLRRVGLAVSAFEKLAILASVAETLDFFHTNDMHVGDFSCKNLLFARGPTPSAYFIDCDSMTWAGESALGAGDTPGWELPTPQQSGTAPADVYKFALLVLRLHTGAQHHRDPARLPPGSGRAVGDLLASSLAPDPSARPPIRDWLGPLRAAAASADTTPVGGVRVPVRTPTRPAPVGRGGRPAQPAAPPPAPAEAPLLPPGRVNDALLGFARRLLVRSPAAPTLSRLARIVGAVWAACGAVVAVLLAVGSDLGHLAGTTQVAVVVGIVLTATIAFYLAATEPS